jgi:hypothetical protein
MYMWFEHPRHTYGCFGFHSRNRGVTPTHKQVRSFHIRVEKDPVRRPGQYNFLIPLKSYVSFVWMKVLDSFISPIPRFDGDIPILAIPVLAQPPSDPSAGASASGLKTGVGKRKATTNPTT